MSKNVVKILVLLCIVFGFTAQGFAEPTEYLGGPPTKQQRDRVRDRIETLKMWKLTKALDLDETSSAKIFPILNRYDKKKAEIHQDLREGMREMRKSLKENRTEGLKNTLAMLEEKHRALQNINDEERAELKKVLTVEQQAKLILFRHEFDREVHKLIADAKDRRHKRGGKGRGAMP